MKAPATHLGRVFGTPWPGVYGTCMASGRHYGRHWHATFGLGLLDHGAQSSASGRGPVEAYAGDLITTNPGEVHDGRPLGGPARHWRMLYLDPAVMASMGAPAVELTRPVISDNRLRGALLRLLAQLQDWHPGRVPADTSGLACEEALVRVCGLLLERHSTRAPEPAARADLRRVRERLADDLLNPPTLPDLAALAGLSKYQVLRRFERLHGMPPHAWLQSLRVERVRALIRQGASLADAAAGGGFADQSHMTRFFMRQFGFTPGAWRATQGAGPGLQ